MSSVLFLENIEDVVLHLRLWEEFFVCLKTARMRLYQSINQVLCKL